MFDKKFTLRCDESDEDNFDLIRDTSEKLALPKPILKRDLYKPLQTLVRKNCIPLLKQILNSLEPEDPVRLEQGMWENTKKTAFQIEWMR